MADYTKRPAASTPAGGNVSLSKVTLTKSAPSVSLAKGGGASGQMKVNLAWNARPEGTGGGGFLKKLTGGDKGIDLDLGCLWELTDGRKGVVQALGNAFGSLDKPPYVLLDGDDRTGGGGENMTINLDRLSDIKRILVFAFIYDGVPAWDKADGVVTLYPQGGAPIEVRLDEASGSRMCAIALLENSGGSVRVNREVKYIKGAQDALDRAYNWGMDWSPGRK
ncbi:MAG TPA: tellurium resistance protein [Mycobacteriales bacterium]|jgi:tellurite resistance protein TerA|nr:tellurium resistance protein [Mycobacteriales bacterium]